MEVRPCAAAGISAETDDLACMNRIAGLYHTFTQVTVPCFETVVVTDDDQVAVSALVVARYADLTAECGIDRVAGLERYVDTAVAAAAACPVARTHRTLDRIVVAFERVDQLDCYRARQVSHLDIVVGKERYGIPMLGIVFDIPVIFALEVYVSPGVVVEQHHLYGIVCRGERIDGQRPVAVADRCDGLRLDCQQRFDRIYLQLHLLKQLFHTVGALGFGGRHSGDRCRNRKKYLYVSHLGLFRVSIVYRLLSFIYCSAASRAL